MINQKKAFTLAELVIVITIIVTLTSVSFVSYMSNLVDSRNATRVSELGNIKISLKNHKINNAMYPNPGASFNITQWATNIVAKQWLLNDDVYTTEIVSKPKDPYVTQRYYTYSVTANRLSFQLWSIIENEEVAGNDLWLLALIDGDYQTKSVWVLPSIIVAASSNTDISTNSSSFVVNKSTLNLPYDLEWVPYKSASTLAALLWESNIEVPKFFWYSSCQEIFDNWAFFGTGKYQITDANSVNGTVICAQCNGWTTVSTGSFANNVCN